jgi:ABC-2 type transport system ATP-binding protein
MLVKAFFIEPKIILLDEPTASLDPDISREICAFLLEQREKTGLSILFTSHKMEEVMEVCDRAIFLKEGKIVADDLPKNLARSASQFQLRLIILDGMKRTVALAQEKKLPFEVDHRSITISIAEKEIPLFLNSLGRQEISYSAIQIEEPSLEDYFFTLTKKRSR